MTAQLEVRKIDLWSIFKISFFICAVLGLLCGVIYAFFMLIVGSLGTAGLGEEFEGLGVLTGVFGLFMIPFMAFMYGIFGSVSITIGAWVYNMIAGLSGGVRLETIPVEEPAFVAPVMPPGVAPPPASEPEPPAGPATPEPGPGNPDSGPAV